MTNQCPMIFPIDPISESWKQNHFQKSGLTVWVESYYSQTEIATYIELCKYFRRRHEEADKNGCFHWKLISLS